MPDTIHANLASIIVCLDVVCSIPGDLLGLSIKRQGFATECRKMGRQVPAELTLSSYA
jgi:hypothetical protein